MGLRRKDVADHVPLALQCVYGSSDETGKNGDGSEISGKGKRVEINSPFAYR